MTKLKENLLNERAAHLKKVAVLKKHENVIRR